MSDHAAKLCRMRWESGRCHGDGCPYCPEIRPPRSYRALVVVNIALIPYVWLRFPREAREYTRNCWRVLRG